MNARVFLAVFALFLAAAPALRCEDLPDAFVYTFEGKGNIKRLGKISNLRLDMPLRNEDSLKIDSDSSVDFVFYTSVGVRVFGPCEIFAKSVSSVSDVYLRVSGGAVLLHTETGEDAFGITIETPQAVVTVKEPAMMSFEIAPSKDGDGGRTFLLLKKGAAEVTAKAAGAGLRMLENQKLEVSGAESVPPVMGASLEELQPAERARTVYVAQQEENSPKDL